MGRARYKMNEGFISLDEGQIWVAPSDAGELSKVQDEKYYLEFSGKYGSSTIAVSKEYLEEYFTEL